MTQYKDPSPQSNGQIAPKMGQFIPHSCQPIKNNLQWAGVMIDNDLTTTQIAVKPSRHSLVIFMPKIYGATNPIVTTGIKTQRHFYKRALYANTSQRNVTSYGGLIRPNKIAFLVNKSSRLFAVVETRHPILWSGKTTKQIGGHTHA